MKVATSCLPLVSKGQRDPTHFFLNDPAEHEIRDMGHDQAFGASRHCRHRGASLPSCPRDGRQPVPQSGLRVMNDVVLNQVNRALWGMSRRRQATSSLLRRSRGFRRREPASMVGQSGASTTIESQIAGRKWLEHAGGRLLCPAIALTRLERSRR